ncbi:sugar phosphate isomerase/epimerase family protein [Novosphingobium piscinae]|uniref:TIM barrel protein n=1 Tax=Novosphingobium piscinae TaxID=1507448 RepID=A0A7X1G0L2_9SPHN|nr:TIM barrel protein [Novosphingobium piscinae]MBC2669752.1 TIM barrel protein [Novosphingobium piscinae]
MQMTRRRFGQSALAATLFAGFPSLAIAEAEGVLPRKSPLGVAATGLSAHLRGLDGVAKGLREDPVAFLDYVRSLGGGGVQIGVGQADISRFRARLEQLGMYYEGQASLPTRSDGDYGPFEASVRAAAELGATCVRAVSRPPADSTGRRYESFTSLADWSRWLAEANTIIERCVPIAEKYRVAIALENHKDRTVAEHVALLKRIDSAYLGSLIDPGNNMSFMERPEETVTALAPWVKACSLKDMGVAPYAEGFLLSEVLFDTGMTDQARLFAIMRKANPRIFPTTELITRDPLKVPVLTDRYHAAFADRRPRVDRWMAMVRRRQTALPIVSTLSPAEQFRLEEENNRRVFAWGLAKLA